MQSDKASQQLEAVLEGIGQLSGSERTQALGYAQLLDSLERVKFKGETPTAKQWSNISESIRSLISFSLKRLVNADYAYLSVLNENFMLKDEILRLKQKYQTVKKKGK